MTYPMISLAGLEEPSVAVRCSPVLYQIIKRDTEGEEPLIGGKYRIVFAVVTTSSVYVYDSQHPYPLARLEGLHFACINVRSSYSISNTLF